MKGKNRKEKEPKRKVMMILKSVVQIEIRLKAEAAEAAEAPHIFCFRTFDSFMACLTLRSSMISSLPPGIA